MCPDRTGRLANKCVNLTVRAVTAVAVATAAPTQPAGYAQRYTH